MSACSDVQRPSAEPDLGAVEPCHGHVCSDPGSEPSFPCAPPRAEHHGQDEQSRAHSSFEECRGGTPEELGPLGVETAPRRNGRARRGRNRHTKEREDSLTAGHYGAQPCQCAQSHSGGACEGELRPEGGTQRHGGRDPAQLPEPLADHDRASGRGHHGVREAQCEDLPRGDGVRCPVRRMGPSHGTGSLLFGASPSLRDVVGPAREQGDQEEGCGDTQEEECCRRLQETANNGHKLDEFGIDTGGGHGKLHEFGVGTHGKLNEFGVGQHGGDAHDQSVGRDDGEDLATGPGPGGGPHGEATEDCGEAGPGDGGLRGQPLSQSAARVLEHKSQRVVPEIFEGLVGESRLELFEIASGSGDSLVEMFTTRTGRSDCACRSSLWNDRELSRPEGLAVTLEQIRVLRPKHVWIRPSVRAFSPLQNLNQKTPAQVRDLKAKRALEIKTLESTAEIVKTCLQLGCHVTVALAERSEAWRLPVLQDLRFHMNMYTCVAKGCAVGLKGQEGRLLQKGWRFVTSHARLSEKLHKPCRCHTNYKHGRSEGSSCDRNGDYPKELSRLIWEALSCEGDLQEVVSECSGHSRLPEGFGLGLRCSCEQAPRIEECGSCLLEAREPTEASEAGYLGQDLDRTLESEAQKVLERPQNSTLQDLERTLTNNPLRNHGSSRRNQEQPNTYHAFGAYAYGNQYGVTNRSQRLPNLCRLVNTTLKNLLPSHLTWTSFVINHGSYMPIHRDAHNDSRFLNGSVGFGRYEGGGLWVEGTEKDFGKKGKVSIREGPNGECLEGREFDIRHKPLTFSPKARHGSCEWSGDRWVVTVYVCRGWDNLKPAERASLEELGFPCPTSTSLEAYPAEQVPGPTHTNKQEERIKKQLYLLHCATGHSHPRHMIQALKARGVDQRTLELAEAFKCPVCIEKNRPPPRVLASFEPLPPKLATISADVGHWTHPHTSEVVQFMIVIDEGSRYRVARVLTQGARQAPKAQDCIHYLQEGWVQYFGHPRVLRLDPAGAFRSAALEEWCDRHQIHLDIVPGEAHWKIGTVENAVKGVKEVMQKLCEHEPELSPQEALAEAVVVFNQKDLIRGFSPTQHILGQSPDSTGRFTPGSEQPPPGCLVENPEGEFERSVQRRLEAEKCLLEWQARQRLNRARNSRHRPCYDYEPGELVFYWRTQDANKGRRQPGGKHGRFLGPARVLATESRKGPGGETRPGGAIWLVKGRSLLKCSPEQLRRASPREELVESLATAHGDHTPWTFHSAAEQIGGGRFEDLSSHRPDLQEWRRAQEVEEEVPPSRFRIRQKRPAERPLEPSETADDPEELPEARTNPAARQRARLQEPRGENEMAWWNTIPEDHWPSQRAGYWNDQTAAVAIEISFPDTNRGCQKAFNDLGSYFVGSMKRRAVELSEKRMSAEEKESFNSAKAVEVKNFVASQAFEILPDHLKPDASQAIGMRWILTWKLKEDGSRKAKARAVLLGYQDGSYEHRATTSPVMTRQTRQLMLQMCAWRRWRVQKGDVTGAFLQSRQYPDKLYCIPCPEICRALNIAEGSITRVRKACYGLVDAPLEWYRSVDEFLSQLGFRRLWSDACCWVLREGGELRGMVSGHVDDFLFGGKDGDALWEGKVQAIKEKFKWGDWESKRFTQCGVIVEQTAEGFELSQPSYLENLHEIGVNATRRKDTSQPTNDREKSQLRALLGGISWHAHRSRRTWRQK